MRAALPSCMFDGGPPLGLERRIGLVRPDNRRTKLRAAMVILIGWLPLLVLASKTSLGAFLGDWGAHARYLIAAPLLIVGEVICFERLQKVINHFVRSGIIRPEQQFIFNRHLDSTGRLLNARWCEVLAFFLTYVTIVVLGMTLPVSDFPTWMVQTDPSQSKFTAAGLWHHLVSLPLLILLLLGWMWRQVLWGRLLWLTSRLDLRLIPAHPDGSGGLTFLNLAIKGYWLPCLAFTCIVAGRIANDLKAGMTLQAVWVPLGSAVACIFVLFLLPFALFAPSVRAMQERGMVGYDTLAQSLGMQFEPKWISPKTTVTQEALEANDFSATTDLYQVVSNVHHISFFPLRLRFILELAFFCALPFIPIILSRVPINVVLSDIARLLV